MHVVNRDIGGEIQISEILEISESFFSFCGQNDVRLGVRKSAVLGTVRSLSPLRSSSSQVGHLLQAVSQ